MYNDNVKYIANSRVNIYECVRWYALFFLSVVCTDIANCADIRCSNSSGQQCFECESDNGVGQQAFSNLLTECQRKSPFIECCWIISNSKCSFT